MTKKERAVRDRAWLKMKVFSITASLQRKMAADKTLTDEQKEWLAYIQNKVLIESRKAPTLWANIGAKYFSEKIGPGYRTWIDYLLRTGEVEVNESYKQDGGSGFTKSYRVPTAAAAAGIVKATFQRKKIQPPRSKPVQSTGDVVVEFVRKNLRRLTVAEKLLWGPDVITDALIHEFCWRIFFGDFDLRYGATCRRLYHAVIEMPKEGRANLKLTDSTDQLFEYDVKSCHPVLMLNLFTDPAERQRYSQLLDVDVYDGLAAVMKKALSRDEVKDVFAMAVNDSDRDLTALERNWVYRFFRQEFPIFTQQVLNVRGDLALHLQNTEAKLMVEDLGRFCLANDFFWIPCHDGWMGMAKHEQQIIGKVHELFHSYCGFPVVVSKLELVGRSTLSLIHYPLSGSYVQGNDTSPTAPALEQVEGMGGGIEKAALAGQAKEPPPNPWRAVVDEWKRQNDPVRLQEAAIKRAEARKRQKGGAKLAKANYEASRQLAKEVGELMKKLGD